MARVVSASSIERRVRALGDPVRAQGLQRFFKTGPGDYGEGDRFLGLTMPQVRQLAAEFASTPLDVLEQLLDSPWHEVRMLALVVMAAQSSRVDEPARTAFYRLYLRRTDRINNWDLVDVTAPSVVGAHLLNRPRSILRRLARSKRLWERRIAIVSTYAFIRRNEFSDTIALATLLLRDRHDLMHKAVGWMLREVGKRDKKTLLRFLEQHADVMPRTMLRYAIERLSPHERQDYMARRSTSMTPTKRQGMTVT